MGTSSILGAEHAPTQAEGRDIDALGPSDSSDSGSDVQGEPGLDPQSDREEILSAPHSRHAGDTDASGTGERGSALTDERVRDGEDILPDRVEGLGGEDPTEDLMAEDEFDDEDLSELDLSDDAMSDAEEHSSR